MNIEMGKLEIEGKPCTISRRVRYSKFLSASVHYSMFMNRFRGI